MLTKDFIREVRELGFEAYEYRNYDDEWIVEIEREEYHPNRFIAEVKINKMLNFSTRGKRYDSIEKDVKEKLFNLMVEYAKTPIEERKGPKRFYLEFIGSDSWNFLNYNHEKNLLSISGSFSSTLQTSFTQKEIDEIKEKFGVTLSDFKQIPLDEDDKIKEDEEE